MFLKHIGAIHRLITTSHARKSRIVRPFIHRRFYDRKSRNRRNHRARRFATTFENLTNGTRRRRTTRRRRNTEERYEEKKRKSSVRGRRTHDATESLGAKRARDCGPTACIRGNRRVGAGFRLSVAIATSTALWLGERATDGKSLVRTIISRVAILQSGPSRSGVLHTHRDVATHPRCGFRFRLSLRHVAVRAVASRVIRLVVLSIFALFDITACKGAFTTDISFFGKDVRNLIMKFLKSLSFN